MPRIRWTPERDAPLIDAVYADSPQEGFSPRTQRDIDDVRRTFVQDLGWNRERLGRYRFRVLAAAARRDPERRTVLIRPPGARLAGLPEGLLESQLAHMSTLPLADAEQHFTRLFGATPEVMDLLSNYRIELGDKVYEKARELAQARGRPVRPGDDRNGNPDLSQLIAALIEEAHERLH